MRIIQAAFAAIVILLLAFFLQQVGKAQPLEQYQNHISQIGGYKLISVWTTIWHVNNRCFVTWDTGKGITSQPVPCPWEFKPAK